MTTLQSAGQIRQVKVSKNSRALRLMLGALISIASMAAHAADVTIKDLKYSSLNGGAVIIESSGPVTYRTREVPAQNQIVVELSNVRLPEKLKVPFVTKDFKQAITSFNAYQDAGSNSAKIIIQLSHAAKADVNQSGGTLMVAAQGGADGDFDNESLAESESGNGKILPTSSLDKTNSDDMRFYGKPISIEVRDTPVRDVIGLIAEQSGANIIVSGETEGNITMKLRQIPWDHALLLVMKSKNLGYVRQGSVLRIAPMAALQKETDDARKMADAQKLAEALKVRVIPVSYANPTNLATQLKDFLSERGKVVADIRTSSVVVTDVEENLVRIANLVKALDIPPLQVQIEGKVVEAGDRFNRDFGITWGSRGQDVALGGNLSLAQNISVSAPSEGGKAGELSLRLGTLDILGDLTAALSLYEKNSLVRIVSSPRIVTMNNEAASIVQSTNIPIPQIQQTNNGPTTSYTYRPIELRLEVTPQITADNDVIMALTIKREFAASIDKTPDINSREAKTKVLVHNGQTAVIGGIYQSDQTDQAAGVPWLKDVPVLGWLFKSTSKSSTKNELLLFLTPRILNAEQGTPKEGTL